MRHKGRTWFRLAFLAPAVLLYLFFVLQPLVQAFQLAFFRLRGMSARQTFVGWENFQDIFESGIFARALGNNFVMLGVCVMAIMVLAFPVALFCQEESPLSKFVRSIYLFPHVISLVVVGILWQAIFNPRQGLLTAGLEAVGFSNLPAWLGDKRFALPAVMVAFVWYGLGFSIMVLQAGLKGISADVNEAAELDGAKGWQKFLRIQWPLTWPTRRIVVLHTSIGCLNTFALVRLMTQGGPDRASEVSLNYLYRRGFEESVLGEATAMAVMNFVVVLVVVGGMTLLMGRNPVEGRKA
jgi:N-acetylglucosamine transport system permease protein